MDVPVRTLSINCTLSHIFLNSHGVAILRVVVIVLVFVLARWSKCSFCRQLWCLVCWLSDSRWEVPLSTTEAYERLGITETTPFSEFGLTVFIELVLLKTVRGWAFSLVIWSFSILILVMLFILLLFSQELLIVSSSRPSFSFLDLAWILGDHISSQADRCVFSLLSPQSLRYHSMMDETAWFLRLMLATNSGITPFSPSAFNALSISDYI